MLSHINLKRGISLPLFFFLLAAVPALAQQKDTTQQGAPQLQTLPQAPEPDRKPVRQPVAVPAPAPTPPPAPAPSQQKEPAKVVADTTKKEKEAFDILKKLFVGGSGTLSFQSSRFYGNYFDIGVSPLLGYKVTRYLAFGPGLIYQFYTLGGTRNHDYGVKFFGQAIISRSFLIHAEHSLINSQDFRADRSTGQIISRFRTNLATTLLGGGYRTMTNDRFGIDLYVLFPVNYSTNTYTQSFNPVIRGGFIYHLK